MARYLCFFFVFSAENCFFSACVWCVRFHAREREREECFFSRGADSFLLLLFFLASSSLSFFFAERKQAEQLFKFCFHTRETCVLRRKVISHIVII